MMTRVSSIALAFALVAGATPAWASGGGPIIITPKSAAPKREVLIGRRPILVSVGKVRARGALIAAEVAEQLMNVRDLVEHCADGVPPRRLVNGTTRLSVRLSSGGHARAWITRSSLHLRAVERCAVKKVRSVRFPVAHGTTHLLVVLKFRDRMSEFLLEKGPLIQSPTIKSHKRTARRHHRHHRRHLRHRRPLERPLR